MVSWLRRRKASAGPVCQCGHGRCYHGMKGEGPCYKGGMCSCMVYTGPEPLDLQVAADPVAEEWAARKVRGKDAP
jgi:hypothetical protein